MNDADIDRVFGRSRLRMVTGEHVEVFREAALPGERRRYTKRFLATPAGDFRQWTEREWRILARLVGHGIEPVPDVVQFDRGAFDRPALVQTYDAGITVDHWATLLPVERDGSVLPHAFEDCAHWWALARHCLIALDAIHALQLVHLDLKADNVCIPFGPDDFDPQLPGAPLRLCFERITLIDYAFSLVSGEPLASALPIACQAGLDYQSPRLLAALEAGRRGDLGPTRRLDWRCDLFSLAAMLRRFLPDPEAPPRGGWTGERHGQARALVRRLLEVHDADAPSRRPHAELIAMASRPLDDAELSRSLERGWALSRGSHAVGDDIATPITRIAMPLATGPRSRLFDMDPGDAPAAVLACARPRREAVRRTAWIAGLAATAALSLPWLGEALFPQFQRQPAMAGAAPDSPVPPSTAASSAGAAAGVAPTLARATVGAPPAAENDNEQRVATSRAAAPDAQAEAAAGAEGAKPEITRLAGKDPAAEDAARRAPAVPAAASVAPAAPSVAPAAPSVIAAYPASAAAAKTPAPRTARADGSLASDGKTRRVVASGSTRPGTSMRSATQARSQRAAPLQGHVAMRAGAYPPATASHAAALRTASAQRAVGASRVAQATVVKPLSAQPAAVPAAPTAPHAQASASTTSVAGAVPGRTIDASTRPRPVPPTTSPPIVASDPRPAPDYAARANQLIATQVPRIAQRAERAVLRVLFAAARADDDALRDGDVRDAAAAIQRPPDEALLAAGVAAVEARLLDESARVAFQQRGNALQAVDLQTRAFGANPTDAQVAGNLAFLRLRQRPAQAELARELALHALTLRDARHPNGRIEDWTTFAIASALSGRDRDARNAWRVTVALAPQIERQCRVALDAYATYGERVRPSVEAMLYRLNDSERSSRSPLCEWPPYWAAQR